MWMKRSYVGIVLLATVAAACGGGEPGRTSDVAFSVADVGFQTPESVLHDSAADVYLVSNINGNPLAKDDDGFISRVSPDGELLELKWIDGAEADVALNAPKGLAIKGDTLFVADIDAVRAFDRLTGRPIETRTIPGATFLNDMAVGPDGTVYVTDSGLEAGAEGLTPSGTDAVYQFGADGEAVPLVSGEALGRPNGIVVDGERILVVTFGTGDVTYVQAGTGVVSGVPKPPAGQLDGIVQIAPGHFLISSWEGRAVYRLGAGGRYDTVVDSVEAPADIGWDAGRSRVLIPLFTANRVEIRPVR
jgi:hypothetical protein